MGFIKKKGQKTRRGTGPCCKFGGNDIECEGVRIMEKKGGIETLLLLKKENMMNINQFNMIYT